MKFILGTDSTWSLRVWLCAQIAQVDIETDIIDLAGPDYKTNIEAYSPVGLVPVLLTDAMTIHDSLAIAEYLNDVSHGSLLPADVNERAQARSLVCEMHAGFIGLRSNFPLYVGVS